MRMRHAAMMAGLALGLMSSAAHAALMTFNYTGAFQTYTIGTTGIYNITAFGASGGNNVDGGPQGTGGLGAQVSGDFALVQGEVLTIVVGGRGSDGVANSYANGGGGGGGGSYVVAPGSTPLAAAGGGGGGGGQGGGGLVPANSDGQAGTTAGNGGGATFVPGGTFGLSTATYANGGGGGSGFYLSGNGEYDAGNGGADYLNGEGGGHGAIFGGNGGFGGGGGGSFSQESGGGGGGISGGGGGFAGAGGGGGSYLASVAILNADYVDLGGVNNGDGYVTIGLASEVSAVPLPASASMFGAALLALGAVGYGVKRKKAAASA